MLAGPGRRGQGGAALAVGVSSPPAAALDCGAVDEALGDDLLWRELTLAALAVVAVVFVIGGLASQVGGTWRLSDGTTWSLRQRGPWVRGVAVVPDGRQLLRGWVWFGRLSLTRRDYGIGHLCSLGFDAAQARAAEGQVTGNFSLRQRSLDLLEGSFVGRAFSFAAPGGPPRSRSVAAVPRRLQRVVS